MILVKYRLDESGDVPDYIVQSDKLIPNPFINWDWDGKNILSFQDDAFDAPKHILYLGVCDLEGTEEGYEFVKNSTELETAMLFFCEVHDVLNEETNEIEKCTKHYEMDDDDNLNAVYTKVSDVAVDSWNEMESEYTKLLEMVEQINNEAVEE